MRFYAYLWMREDGTPYYAGKGSGNRAFIRGSHHVKPPTNKSQILIFNRDSEQGANDTERELIRNWGRKDLGTGCLRNFTDGGEGQSGLRHTTAAKKNMSRSQLGHPSYVTPAGIAKMKASRKGRGLGNTNNKGKKKSAEWRAAFSLRMKQVWANDSARREKLRTKASQETRQRMSESGKAAWLKRKAQGERPL